MPLYRAKPVEIEAVRWDGEQFLAAPPWLVEAMTKPQEEVGAVWVSHPYAVVRIASHCALAVDPGAFIVREAPGRLSVLAAERFTALYTPVPDLAAAVRADEEAA